jgi:hypothetical protein
MLMVSPASSMTSALWWVNDTGDRGHSLRACQGFSMLRTTSHRSRLACAQSRAETPPAMYVCPVQYNLNTGAGTCAFMPAAMTWRVARFGAA